MRKIARGFPHPALNRCFQIPVMSLDGSSELIAIQVVPHGRVRRLLIPSVTAKHQSV